MKKRLPDKLVKIVRVLLMLLVLIAISVGIYFVLRALGLSDFNDIKKIVASTGGWGPIVFLLLQIFVGIILFVIPGTNMMFIAASVLVFDTWLAILLNVIGVWLSSIIMFMIGKIFGEKAIIKLIGEEDLRKVQNLIDTKSKILLPIMFLFPFFPDDELCLAAGLTKMKYRYFIPVVMIFRTVGVVVSTLIAAGTIGDYKNILDVGNWRVFDWIVAVNLVIIDGYLVWKFSTWLEKKIKTKEEKKKDVIEENDKTEAK
ncbi:VTT domain-containing protein [Acholeplasma sp. OttesenSCG-928-E16]|nr:VTT domain-containing protein [Acholeplasma sp. OttesenSCG-928-E16]